MPKRSNPSNKTDGEKEAKKARTDDTTPPINNGVGFFGKLFGYRPANSDATLTSNVVANRKKKTPISSSSSSKEVKSTKSNAAGSSSSVGSNTLLKSLRDNAAVKKSQTSTTTKTKAKNRKRESTTKLPVVPFPHLPLTESQNKKSTTKSTLLLVIILAILNITSAIYIGILYSNNNIHQFKYAMEINKLHDELTSSKLKVDILRYRMNALEDVVDRKEKLMMMNEENGEEEIEMLTSEERKAFMEEIKLLEDERQKVMDEFNKNLSAF